jgi:hypothetical protein
VVAHQCRLLGCAEHKHAFVVQDGSYISARWPGDSYLFAERFETLLRQGSDR